jgi:hypothetical protein
MARNSSRRKIHTKKTKYDHPQFAGWPEGDDAGRIDKVKDEEKKRRRAKGRLRVVK